MQHPPKTAAIKLESENQLPGYQFHSVFENSVRIGPDYYRNSLIITPETIIPNWPPTVPEHLTVEDLEMIIALQPELILVGTGSVLKFPPPFVLEGIANAGLGIDFMDSRAACRTYNVLFADGRRVAAGVMLNDLFFRSGLTTG